MRNFIVIALSLLPMLMLAQGSIGSFAADETLLYAQTKQVNQFFLRFNAEEDIRGNRLYPGDNGYHDLKNRKKYLEMLFDNSSPLINEDKKFVFVEDALNKRNPAFLDFYSNKWFAELSTTFHYKKEKVNIILYLKIEKQLQGYKWVISNVYFDKFESWFSHINDTLNTSHILHPMSHELDFMNIHKAFREPENIDYYLQRNYRPDMLSLFIMEVKNGNLVFGSVNEVKFHIFQIPNWYFELSWFNRNSTNSGWLISNVIRVNDEEKKTLMQNYTRVN